MAPPVSAIPVAVIEGAAANSVDSQAALLEAQPAVAAVTMLLMSPLHLLLSGPEVVSVRVARRQMVTDLELWWGAGCLPAPPPLVSAFKRPCRLVL